MSQLTPADLAAALELTDSMDRALLFACTSHNVETFRQDILK